MQDKIYTPHHVSVLHMRVVETLSPKPGEAVLDVTAGLGGHAASFAERIGPGGTLILVDADAKNLASAKDRLKEWKGTLQCIHSNFRDLPSLSLPPIDILLADLGLSSPHLDDAARGFSFRNEGPLDMRFDQTQGISAAQLIEASSHDALCRIFRQFGEMQHVSHLAEAIAGKKLETTAQLKEQVEAIFGFRAKATLPQVFQALRIAVNDEIGALELLLASAPHLLAPGGRMGVISFHSLEDRMVKQAFKALSEPERNALTGKISKIAPFELLTKKPIIPSPEEILENPRSRSAKFRIIRRLP